MTLKDFSMNSFVAGFMLGALVIGAWWLRDSISPVSLTSAPAPHVSSQKIVAQSGAISVADQPAGSSVIIESVTVPPPGVWVAVRETNGAELGNVLGAVRVNGPLSAITVPLLRAAEPGLVYAVELYRDDGGGSFDLATDSVYVDFETGAPVVAYFTTTN